MTTFSYDALNRRTLATYADQSITAYTWDGGNRLTQVVDSQSGTISRGYDGLDRLTSETTPQGSVSYTYDAAGRRTGMTVAGQTQVAYTYDNANRLTSILQGTAQVGFTYDAASRRSSLTLPNGVVATYTYDSANRLAGITYSQGGTALGNLAYTYDADGRRTAVSGSLAQTGLPQAVAGTYDAANRLTAWGAASLTYDANGNLTSDGANSYTWDARNRLAAMSGASFQYDPFGRRIGKTVSGTTTNFLYDGLNATQELSGITPTANLVTGLGIDEVFSRTDSVGARYFLTDGLGSTLALTDGAGVDQTSYGYEPYGNTTPSGAASTNSFQYTGRENDGTGLYYYRARYYNPAYQRFVSEDPLGIAAGPNPYVYVGGNPLSRIDPLGLDWFRPDGHPYMAGRAGTIVPEGPDGIGRIVDDYVPAGHTFASIHDNFVDQMTNLGLPDWLVNIPFMPATYLVAVTNETLNSIAGLFNVNTFAHHLQDDFPSSGLSSPSSPTQDSSCPSKH